MALYRPTDEEIASVIDKEICGYRIVKARRKTGSFSDSDYYGIALAVSTNNNRRKVTWHIRFEEDAEPSFDLGHYYSNASDDETDYLIRE